MNENARKQIHGYADARPELLPQLHDFIPAEPGVMKVGMVCLMVGVVDDPRRWWNVTPATEFYKYLRNQLRPYVLLEEVKVPRSMQSHLTAKPSGNRERPGQPTSRDGRISKRHLKRVEKKKERSLYELV